VKSKRKSGDVYPKNLVISAFRDNTSKSQRYVTFLFLFIYLFIYLFTNITYLKAHQQQLDQAAYYCVLTNRPNRALLADHLSIALL
jgi:hypothetical protein